MGFIQNVGMWELMVILVLALIIFGPGKLPEVGKAIGKGIREFKRSVNAVTDEQDDKAPAQATRQAAADGKGAAERATAAGESEGQGTHRA